MLSRADQVLAKALQDKRLVAKELFDILVAEAQTRDVSLLGLVVAKGVVSEVECLRLLGEALGLEVVDLGSFSVSKDAVSKVPVKIATYYKFFPLKIHDRMLTVAVSKPFDTKTEDEVRMQLGFELRMALACEKDVLKMLQAHYGIGAETIGQILSNASEESVTAISEPAFEKIEDIEKSAEDASVIKLVNQILLEACKRRATDIHIEPYRNKVRLRYRVDGVLYDANVAPELKRFLNSILSRIKIMANLNIVEHRLSQDGRAVVKTQDQTVDLRVSFIPTPYGESVVIRILPAKMLFSLSRLGLSPEQLKIFESLIDKPHGIIFVTGPTGSGKTTTLYACLSDINTSERKIITIEDPIEYEMEGITQIQVMPEIGWTFARGLRSMLRHDPDVMMVGEVRDLETAEISIRVALTGHLVLSTLHTNDAASGVTRLIDIGLEPYLVASSVEAFIAQRLVRVLCSGCKRELPPDQDDTIMVEMRKQIATDMGLASIRDVKIFSGAGCQACNGTGFFGRTAIYEILLMDNVMRELVVKKATSSQIKKIALSRGMRTLRQDGWMKVMQGVTTVDEVVKVTQAEEAAMQEFMRASAISAPGGQEESVFGQKMEDLSPGDKRNFARLHSRVNLRFKIFDSMEQAAQKGYKPDNLTVTGNLSAGGLLFYANEAVAVGALVEVKLELPDSKDPIVCLAKVVRVEEIESGRKYNIAVQYMDITSAYRARINKFILE
jgi:type II secretory ATPase GspE/PulE/Tfp pilus assembly ATPase PilB-like protein